MGTLVETAIIYGFYGLAFFTLGVAVLVRSLPLPHSSTKLRFVSLGLFGLIHGVFEWVTLGHVTGVWATTDLFRQGLAVASYGALLVFGLGVQQRRLILIGGVVIVAFALQIATIALPQGPALIELISRWGVAVPASSIAAFQFFADQSLRTDSVFARRGTIFGAGVLGLYALTQVFTSPAEFFPANLFNAHNFEIWTGMSVLVARTICGFLLTCTAIALLSSFDEAMRLSAQAESSRHSARYVTILQSQRECIAALAPDGTVLELNKAGLAMIGESLLDRILGRNFLDLLPPRFHDAFKDAINRVYRGQTVELEYQIQTEDGQLRWVNQVASPVRDPDNPDQVEEMIAVIHDVTDLRRSLEEMTQLKRDAEAANLAKSEFLSTMSHEIRTPLNGVLGMLSVLKRRETDPDTAEYIAIADQSGRNLLTIVDDILDFNRIEAGKLSIRQDAFSVQELIDRAVTPLQTQAEQAGLRFEFNAAIRPETVFVGDVVRTSQIIANLLGNAIKFTPAGRVSLDLDDLTEPTGLRIRVTDTGVGIDAQTVTTIFDRFVQADSSLSREFGGTGLGLAIVSGLLDAMGGTISVESELGSGSAFTVTIPLEQETAIDRSSAGSAEQARLTPATRKRVLIAEDNPLNLATMKAFLDLHDLDCVFAEDGASAIEAARQSEFDLLILDIQMPGTNGIEALSAIRALQDGKRLTPVPAIACTANAFPDQVDTYISAGFDSVITKPLELDEFETMVFGILGGSQPPRPTV